MDDYLTAELANPPKSFLFHLNSISNFPTSKDQSEYDDRGVSKLIVVFCILLADDDAWEQTSTALRSTGNIDHHPKNKTGGCMAHMARRNTLKFLLSTSI
jgi:hypothetical protein